MSSGAPAREADPVAPVALGLLCVALLGAYALEMGIALRQGPAELDAFLGAWGLVPREALGGRVAPLLTAIFLHAGPFHLLSNVAFLVAFGLEVEPRLGGPRFLGLFLGCGLAAGLLHVAVAPDAFVPTVGASGAVSGVLGAWWRLGPAPGPGVRGLGRMPALALLWLWLLAQAAAMLWAGDAAGQATWAHLGDFVAGVAVAPALARPRLRA